ncbi:MAG: acetate/propionate family kinase [Alphaproteobacteria bacterium]
MPDDHGLLIVNAGSSSIKAAVFPASEGDAPLLTAAVERIGSDDASARIRDGSVHPVEAGSPDPKDLHSHVDACSWLLTRLQDLSGTFLAAGHRVVHGGSDFIEPVLVDADVLAKLERLAPLARTHQPHNLAAIRAVADIFPDLPQIACFDTAFHATIPAKARVIALPQSITEKGVRRYGFHGLSYQWIAAHLPPAAAEGRTIVAHLGNGASLCGMVGGISRATTMGFTPLDGLVMGERPGLTDPGAILFLFEELGMTAGEVRRILFRESGLKGISGLSNDMRVLMTSETPAAKLAVDVYIHRIIREIGAIAAEIGGVDALVFTAGIGENAAAIRARVIEGCGWLGCTLDASANERAACCISGADSRMTAHIIPTNEEAVIANAMRRLLNS